MTAPATALADQNPAPVEAVRIGIVGATGRMGKSLVKCVLETPGCVLSGALTRKGHEAVGQDAGLFAGTVKADVPITDDFFVLFEACDVVIDFSTPEATLQGCKEAQALSVPLVIGTTGLTAAVEEVVADTGKDVPVVYSPNTSVGVNVLLALVGKAAMALGPGFDVSLYDLHHIHKKDAPSGTARALAKSVAQGRGQQPEEIPVRSERSGEHVGEHSITFTSAMEIVEFRHKALDRAVFAAGAVRAAQWAALRQQPGLYTMRDVLGLSV